MNKELTNPKKIMAMVCIAIIGIEFSFLSPGFKVFGGVLILLVAIAAIDLIIRRGKGEMSDGVVKWMFIIFIVGIIASVIVGGFCSEVDDGKSISTTIGQNSSKIDNYGHDQFDAIVVAEKTVKKQLKSPSSAKFCKISEYKITLTENTWTVTGYVDSDNSFDANIRSNFLVMFTFENSERYIIDLCSID